ncbi:hypothetical protein [Solitalea lacus]|uniref:hypothetical protein n=1 Tax=Solitalea lacus TaxID=2911172 RepID=UPI001EDC08A4|nr:hypothetical protein [Solitalea lacus]UKJ07001.1 hypothetical protein L2B55_15905 [Solitalea lacus]
MRRLIYLLPLTVILLLEGCSSKTFQSTYRTRPVVADGKLDDWSYAIEDENVDKSGRVKYAIANDKENIYIAMRIFDKTTQAKMFLGGMKMFLDSSLQKQQTVAIEFPLTNKFKPGEKPKWDFKPGERLGLKDLHVRAKENNQEMKVIGFYAFANGKQALTDNKSGISIGFDWDEDNALIYEVIIPFKAFYGSVFKAKKPEIGIGLKIEGIDKNILPEKNMYAMMHQGGRKVNGTVGMNGASGLPTQAEDQLAIYTEPIKYDLKLQLAVR